MTGPAGEEGPDAQVQSFRASLCHPGPGHTRLSPCLLPRSPPSLSLVDCFFLVGFSMKSLPEIFEEMHTYY